MLAAALVHGLHPGPERGPAFVGGELAIVVGVGRVEALQGGGDEFVEVTE